VIISMSSWAMLVLPCAPLKAASRRSCEALYRE
jgi:hypothetical protein